MATGRYPTFNGWAVEKSLELFRKANSCDPPATEDNGALRKTVSALRREARSGADRDQGAGPSVAGRASGARVLRLAVAARSAVDRARCTSTLWDFFKAHPAD